MSTSPNTNNPFQSERRIFDALPISALITRIGDGTVLLANSACTNLLGYPDVDSLLGKKSPAFYWDAQERQLLLERFRAEGSLENYEVRFRRVDDSMIWVSISVRQFAFEGEENAILSTITDITGRKQAEEELQRTKNIVEAVPDFVGLAAPDGTAIYINPAGLAMTGYTAEEFYGGMKISDFQTLPREVFEKVAREGVWEGESEFVRKDGSRFPISQVIAVSKDKQGQIQYLTTVVRDITERKQAEAQLSESEARYQLLSEATIEGVVIHDKGILLDSNQTFAAMFGYDLKEVIGMSAMQFLTPETREITAQNIRSGYEKPYDVVGLRKDGSTFPVEITGKAIPYQGRTVRVTALRDITERKQAEDEMLQQQEKFRTVADFTYDWEYWLGIDGKYAYISPSVKRITGHEVEEFMQNPHLFNDIAHPEDKHILEDHIHKFHAAHSSQSGEVDLRIILPDGSERWLSHLCQPVYDANGTWMGRRGSNRDITERKRLEGEVQEAFERRGYQVQVGTEISQEVASASELSDLFERVVTLTKERLGYYHTQLLRYDAAQDAVVLISGYGETGQKMLAGGHKMPMGEGLIGTAAATGETILRPALINDPDWHPNPLLPDTKGEIAVPIKWQDAVLGVLDVQSNQASALTEDDRLLLEGLCGQIAIAFHNAELVETIRQSEARLAEAATIAQLGYWELDILTMTFTLTDEAFGVFRTTAKEQGGYQMPAADYARKFVHPDEAPVVANETRLAVETDDPNYTKQLEHRMIRADGSEGVIVVNIRILKNEQGQTIKTFGIFLDITERKQAEEALRVNEARLAEALRTARLANWEYDVEKDLFTFNDQFYSIFHTTAEKAGGYQLSSARYAELFVHPDDRGVVGAEIGKALSSTERVHNATVDHRILYEDGGVGYITVQLTVERDENGKITRNYGANQDITERKQAELALRESEQRYQQILDAITDMILVKGPKSSIVWANKAFRDYYGMTNEQLRDMIDAPIVEPDYTLQYIKDDAYVFEKGEVLHIPDEPVTHYDGTVHPFETVKAPIRNLDGNIVMTVGVSRDITDRKQERERIERLVEERTAQLSVAREQFENIINFLPDATLVIDKDGNVMAWNLALEKMTGIPAAEMLGKSDYAYTVPFYGDRRPMMIDFALTPGEAIPERYIAVGEAEHRLSGELYVPTVYGGRGAYLLATAGALYDREGNIMGAVESIRDITDRKQVEGQVERALRETRVRYEVSQALTGAKTEEDVLDLLEQHAGFYPEAQVILITFDRQGDDVTAIFRRDNVYASGLVSTVPIGTRFPAARFPLINLFSQDKPFISNDFLADDRINPASRQTAQQAGANSMAAFPLTAGSEWMGVVIAMAKPAGYFDETKQHLYQTLAEQGAVALQTARLRDQIQSSMTRRGYQVQVSTEIAQEISAAAELGLLFQRVVTVVKERLGYYHTQLLRYDPGRDAIVLIAGYGETGAKMLAAGHKMEMGRGIIGTAAASGEAVLRPNLADDPDWQPNPLLPETKGEIAVPIKLGDQILGVLDVQSSQANALGDDDRLLLEGLCGQIAIAMEQTRLREEMAERLAEINRLYRAMSHEGWQAFRQTGSLPEGFVYDQLSVSSVTNAQLNEELFSNVQMAVPGGEVLGNLMVEHDPLRPFSSDDQFFLQQISEQIALALESARLFEQTQTALAQSEKLSETGMRFTRAADLQELTAITLTTVNIPVVNRAFLVIFNYGEKGTVEHLDIVANWWNGSGHEVAPVGARISREIFQVMPMFISQTPVFFNDVQNDERIDARSLELAKRSHLRAVAVLPLYSGSTQIGALILEAEEPYNFTQDEIRMFTALAPQIATVLENRRQFERAQRQAAREAMLNSISQKIQTATTVEDVLQIAARELGHALGAPMTIAQLSMKNK